MENQRKPEKRQSLFNFREGRVTIVAILDTRRRKEDQICPVRIMVTHDRKQVYYTPGTYLTQDEWKVILKGTKRGDLIEKYNFIKHAFDEIEDIVKDLIKTVGFSFEALNKRLSRGRKNSLADGFNAKIEKLRSDGKLGTAEWYYYSLISIKTFTNRDLKYADITEKWLREYEKWLLDHNKSYTTISMYMRALQAIVKEAQNEGIIIESQYPFGTSKYKIPKGKGRKTALTLLEIGKIIDYKPESKVVQRCRDLWVFSYFCNGININDLLKLKFSNLSDGEIHFYRSKTIDTTSEKREIVAPLLPELIEIIDRWGNKEQKPENYVFPFLEHGMSKETERRTIKNFTRLTNKKLNLIGTDLGLGKISTYTARHSFATVLKRSGANIAFISESLGHSDLKTTENYLASFEHEERLKQAQFLRPASPTSLKVVSVND
jgi:integrase